MYILSQIRKDNPYRKPSSDGKQPSSTNQNSLSYDRIFSDLSASGDDELMNISAIGSNRASSNDKATKVREKDASASVQSVIKINVIGSIQAGRLKG